MSDARVVARLFSNRLLSPLLGLYVVAMIGGVTWKIRDSVKIGKADLSDYFDPYIVGGLVRSGRAACAYSPACLRDAMEARMGQWTDLPWAYPPQYSALVSPFSLVPYEWSYLTFSLLTFALFFLVIRKLEPSYGAFALALVIPAMLINLVNAQNGFLTAAIMGLFAWLYLKDDPRCGIPLGAMIIKPHLAVTLAILVLARRQWNAVTWALAVVAGSSLVVSLALGPSIWAAFLDASHGSATRLWTGAFPMQRMTSVYAMAFQLGLGPRVSMLLHGALAGLVVLVTWVFARHCKDARLLLAVAIAGAVLVSPYNYDYDLPILAISMALAAPKMVDHMRVRDALVLFALIWSASANHQVVWFLVKVVGLWQRRDQAWSLSALLIMAAMVLCWKVLRRASVDQSDRQGAGPAAG